jgi:thioredoxin 1
MAGNAVFEVSDATFDQEVLKSEQPVLVDFWAVWCGPCKAIAPIVDDLATAYAGKLKVAKVDVDKNGATPSRYGIRGIPALLIFKGGKVADQIVGYAPREVIEEKLNRVLALSPGQRQLTDSREKQAKRRRPVQAGRLFAFTCQNAWRGIEPAMQRESGMTALRI